MNRRLSAVTVACVCLTASLYAQDPTQDPSVAGIAPATAVAADAVSGDASAPAASPSEAVAAATPATTAEEPAAAAAARTPVVVRDASSVDLAKEYLIGPEDLLDVLVWKNCPDLCRTVPVRPDGKVSLPLVNDIQAAGLSPADLRTQLTERLSEYVQSPEVSVIVREVHSVKVSVVGAVKMPGHYEVKSPATVLDLIARAQGLNEFASKDKIVVLRQTGETTTRLPFNYRKVADGHEQENFFVRAGDIIVVP
jgi:polysaccharide export outer membrane protein